MAWHEVYDSKLISLETAAAMIRSGDRIYIGASAVVPYAILNILSDRASELTDVLLVGGMLLNPVKFLENPECHGHIDYETFFLNGYDKVGVKNGNTHVNSIHLSQVARYYREVIKPNLLITEVSEPDEEGFMTWGAVGVAWSGDVNDFSSVKKRIVVVNKHQPHCSFGFKNKIHVSEVDAICLDDHLLPEFPQPEVTEVDQQIADLILEQIPDGATLQIGLGGLANAVGYGLGKKKDLAVHTEMLTDSIVSLARAGAINRDMCAAFGLGSQNVYDFLNEGRVFMQPISIVNDAYEIGSHENFISINSCLMADLTGQVGSESIGNRQFSGTGGQLDFVKGAALSKGGKSFLCMHSTTQGKNGELISKVNFHLPEGAIVTDPRSEVMYIVTEYGIADLYLKPIRDRVEAMIAIAHPQFRDELREKALAAGMIQ